MEALGRPQATALDPDEYGQFRRLREEREAFFEWLGATAATNFERNTGLSDEEILGIIEQARVQVATGAE